MLLPAIDSGTHAAMLELERRHPQCRAMMGLHPCSVKDNVEEELRVVEQYLSQRKFVAVGEIGLDFYWDTSFRDQQYAAFHQQIEWAIAADLPIVIHSREATDECLEVVEAHPGVRGVFHCFSGNLSQAKRALDAGMMIGIGGVATFKNGGLDAVLPSLGLEGVVLETDAPYLAPVPYRGKRNEPAYTRLVAERVALLTGSSTEEVALKTTANAIKLFGLS